MTTNHVKTCSCEYGGMGISVWLLPLVQMHQLVGTFEPPERELGRKRKMEKFPLEMK